MNPQDFLQPDPRWSIFGFQSHEQYLSKNCLKGKFHSLVPNVISEAYYTVERLIAYTYFYYPMQEEVGSKLSRIFEMAIRIKAGELGIPSEVYRKGKMVPENLGSLIASMKKNPDVDQDWANEWRDFKSIRNVHAHPKGPNYGGDINFTLIAPMINVINSIFLTKAWFSSARQKITELQEVSKPYRRGLFILNIAKTKFLVTSAIPVVVSHDRKRSLWVFEPVGNKFPQTFEDYVDFNPIILRLTNLSMERGKLSASDYLVNQEITLTLSDHPDNDAKYTNYFGQMQSADQEVVRLHGHNSTYHLYLERERFIYDEYWEYN